MNVSLVHIHLNPSAREKSGYVFCEQTKRGTHSKLPRYGGEEERRRKRRRRRPWATHTQNPACVVLLSCLGLQRKRRGKETKKYKQLLTPSHLFCFVLLRLFAIYFYCTQFLLAAAAHAALTTGSILAKSGVPSPVDASHPLMAFQPSLFSPMALVPAVTSRNMVGLE